jgi:opacity protein-like surface antigen
MKKTLVAAAVAAVVAAPAVSFADVKIGAHVGGDRGEERKE